MQFHRALALVVFMLAASAMPWVARASVPVVQLDPALHRIDAPAAWAWHGSDPSTDLQVAAGGRLPWKPLDVRHAVPLGQGSVLWIKLVVQRPPGADQPWLLEVPVPVVDQVTLFQRVGGSWVSQMAGDQVPMRDWPQAGRYPVFRLQLADGGPTEVYVRIRHSTPLALSWRLSTDGAQHQRAQLEYLALGMVLGALVLLVSVSLVRAVMMRDPDYGWYAVYALLALLALAAFTGVASHLAWGNLGPWVDAAPGCLAAAGGGVAMFIAARVSSSASRNPRLHRLALVTAWAGVPVVLVYLMVERVLGVALLGAHLMAVAALTLALASATWRRGDPVGRWMLMGAVPLALTVAVALGRASGLLQASWLTEYALVLALTIDLPMLFGALSSRSRERRSVTLRQLAAASQDPLTGLLRAAPFMARVQQALARHRRTGEGAALLVVRLANYQWIQKSAGAERAEEALLRAVIALRSLLRDVDATCRLGEERFGLLLEGVHRREAVSSIAARLVAAGLRQDSTGEGSSDIALHFHVGALLLHDHAELRTHLHTSQVLLDALDEVLAGMSARTNRPIRFAEPGTMFVGRPTAEAAGVGGISAKPAA
jgi:GGDEF domain-containing protein